MTIQKRDKRNRGGAAKSPPIPEVKNIRFSPADKMVRNFPRLCLYCNEPTYSAMCRCGRVTVINKGG